MTETLGKVGVTVSTNETVIVRTPYYFSNLSVLFNATEERWGGVIDPCACVWGVWRCECVCGSSVEYNG